MLRSKVLYEFCIYFLPSGGANERIYTLFVLSKSCFYPSHRRDVKTIQLNLILRYSTWVLFNEGGLHVVSPKWFHPLYHSHPFNIILVYIGRSIISYSSSWGEALRRSDISVLFCSPFSQTTRLNWSRKMKNFLQISKYCLVLQLQLFCFVLTICDKIQELRPRSAWAWVKLSYFNHSKNLLPY